MSNYGSENPVPKNKESEKNFLPSRCRDLEFLMMQPYNPKLASFLASDQNFYDDVIFIDDSFL